MDTNYVSSSAPQAPLFSPVRHRSLLRSTWFSFAVYIGKVLVMNGKAGAIKVACAAEQGQWIT